MEKANGFRSSAPREIEEGEKRFLIFNGQRMELTADGRRSKVLADRRRDLEHEARRPMSQHLRR